MEPGTTLLVLGANEQERKQQVNQILAQFFPKASKFNPNLILISGNIGIDQVRNFGAKLSQKPYQGQLQVGLIDIDEITAEAQNALLKLIEEPTSSTQIIISVETLARLLPTIVSRCQKIFVSDWKDQFEPESAKDAKVLSFGNLAQKFALAEKISKSGGEDWIETQIFFWRKVFLVQLGIEVGDLPEIAKAFQKLELKKTFALLKNLLYTKNLTKLNINPRLLLENLFLSI